MRSPDGRICPHIGLTFTFSELIMFQSPRSSGYIERLVQYSLQSSFTFCLEVLRRTGKCWGAELFLRCVLDRCPFVRGFFFFFFDVDKRTSRRFIFTPFIWVDMFIHHAISTQCYTDWTLQDGAETCQESQTTWEILEQDTQFSFYVLLEADAPIQLTQWVFSQQAGFQWKCSSFCFVVFDRNFPQTLYGPVCACEK